jgi:peroxiredoxin
MRNIILSIVTILTFISCGVKEGEYKVEGTVKGLKDDTKLFINVQDSTMAMKTIDTVKIKNGKFLFEGKLPEAISIATVTADGQNVNQIFILENGKINLTIDKDSTHLSKISGTDNNDFLQTYSSKMNEFAKKSKKFEKENMAKIMQAQQAQQQGDNTAIEEIMKLYEPIKKEMDDFQYDFVEKNPKAFINLMILSNLSMNPEAKMEKVAKLFNAIDGSLKEMKTGKELKKTFDNLSKLANGKKAPDFTSKTADGVDYKMSENLGKVTLLDFWASWCGPCRQENPNVVATYNEFKDKGLKIIGISLDQDKAKWLEAIQADKLTWDHVAQLDPQNDIAAKLYQVTSIPTTYLLDEKGNIIAKNLKGDALKSKIAELLQ